MFGPLWLFIPRATRNRRPLGTVHLVLHVSDHLTSHIRMRVSEVTLTSCSQN